MSLSYIIGHLDSAYLEFFIHQNMVMPSSLVDGTYYWLGGFRVTGKVSSQCSLLDPICGELTLEASAVPIHSIDLQLLRVESIIFGEKIATESSLIQTTQVFGISQFINIDLTLFYSTSFIPSSSHLLDSRWRCVSWSDHSNLCYTSPSFNMSYSLSRVSP